MAKGSTSDIPAEQLKRYANLVGSLPSVELKGATMPYTSLNGNMFSFLSPDGALNLRLPTELREKIIAEHKTRLAEQHGAVLKEYVKVPEALLQDTRKAKLLMKASYDYASKLKPKPTKKK